MTLPAEKEQKIIDEIIEKELEMFIAVQNFGGTASCQQRPSSFKGMRWMTHSVLPYECLVSYLDDLKTAKKNDINLLTIKYGRMDDLIPVYNNSPLVGKIADAELFWMKELRQLTPQSFRDADGEEFRRYISCELETLSTATLKLYYDAVQKAQQEKRNLAKERYENFRTRFGMAEGPATTE